MSALLSRLALVRTDPLPAALSCSPPAETCRMRPRAILRSVGGQLRAFFLAQRSLAGQSGDGAWAAEDDHRRLANRCPQSSVLTETRPVSKARS
jgi:hypothetical protein